MHDDDLSPLEPPAVLIAIPAAAIADGYAVIALPGVNHHLGCTLHATGFAGKGWLVRLVDPFGTVLWSLMLEGTSDARRS